MNIKITYNADAKIGAIGPSVWAKLGPEEWFKAYKLVCANSRHYDEDFIVDLGIQNDDLESFTTQNIIETPQFKVVATETLPDYRFIAYKSVVVPAGMREDLLIINPIELSRFENKRVFRELFTGKVPIPEYVMMPFQDWTDSEKRKMYQDFTAKLGDIFVVQSEASGGGRGTFIVTSLEDFMRALGILHEEKFAGQCIVSKFVHGIERSIQVFVSADRLLLGPLQQQLVRNPELLDPEGRGGMFFCGGRFIENESEKITSQIQAITQTIGDILRTSGFRGIFGIDFLVDESETVYVLEINARTTGLLPLLNEQDSEVPLYLLHILELAHEPYEIPKEDIRQPINGPRSFVVLFNQTGKPAYLDETITTGNYKFEGGELKKIDDKARWHPEADIMLQLFCAEDFPAKPNLKLCNIFLKDAGFDDKSNLRETTHNVVELIKRHIIS